MDAVCFFLKNKFNSITETGAHDTVTNNRITKRKRYHCDAFENVFKKYLEEKPLKMYRITFYTFKTFWILRQKLHDEIRVYVKFM